MKKLLSCLLCVCLFITSSLTGYCMNITNDFEGGTISPFVVGSGVVELATDPEDSSNTVIKVCGTADADSYPSTGNKDFSGITRINLKFYRAPGSYMRFYLRDNQSTANNITFFDIGSENVTLGNDLVKISDNTWYYLSIIIDKPNENVLYYLSDADPEASNAIKVTAEKKLTEYSTYSVHNFSSASLRFSISKTTNENVIIYLDDMCVQTIDSNISLNNGLYINSVLEKDFGTYWTPVYKAAEGSYRVCSDVENFENTAKSITVINAVYDKNGLMKSFVPYSESVGAITNKRIYSPFSISDLNEGDTLKTFIVDSKENISPLTPEFFYEKNPKNFNGNPSFNQTMIDNAINSTTLLQYNSTNGNSGNSHIAASLYYLMLLEHMSPGIKSTSGNIALHRILNLTRNLISGGKEPFASPGCFWAHPIIAAAMVLAKNTPTVWREFTADEKDRIDWLMRALSIAGNWGFNDKNNYLTGLDLKGNFNKSWNPNYRNAYLNVVIAGAQYFGADELDKIFVNFDYDTYIKKLTELGFTNIITAWSAAGKDLMENGGSCVLVAGADDRYEAGDNGGSGAGVKIPFTYAGHTLQEIELIFENLMRYTYSFKVVSSVKISDTFTATIASGATSPYEGLMGMMREFDSGDGGGKRSSASYCIDSLIALIPTYANLKLFSDWTSETTSQAEIDELIFIGTEDLIFKCEEGYTSYSLGSARGTTKYSPTGSAHYHYSKDIWRAFHMTFENPYI